MDCKFCENLIFSDSDFFALLNIFGIEKWYGYENTAPINFTNKEEVNRLLVSLYQKGIVEFDNNKVKILSPYSDIFKMIKKSKYCVFIIKRNFRMTHKIFYVYCNYIISVEQEYCRQNSFSVGIIPIEEWKRQILSEDYFPEYIFCDTDSCNKSEFQNLNEYYSDAYYEKNNIITVFEVRNVSTGELKKRVLIQDKGLFGCAYLQEDKNNYMYICSEEKNKYIIDQLFDG